MKIPAEPTVFTITGLEKAEWNFRHRWNRLENGLYQFEFALNASQNSELPELLFVWELPLLDTVNCWTTHHAGGAELQPDWGRKHVFSIADEIPELIFHNREGRCTVAAAYSDAMRSVEFHGGIFESNCSLKFQLRLFSRKEPPCRNYQGMIRLDLRGKFFADAIRDLSAWYASFPEYKAMSIPEDAYEPLYSTWYSYHHNVHDWSVRTECEAASKLGIKTVIVDSGWETDDNTLGPVACGDWVPSVKRFPDFQAHVREIQSMGFRYMLWFAVPFIGKNSSLFEHFRGFYLFELPDAGVLDPRFSEVREFLICTCRNLMTEYGIDGLKLDFINTFTECEKDPALINGMGKRDISTIPVALDRLMTDINGVVCAVRPNALIEFRQCYIGPAIRKYGNMLRAADCPADPEGNRRRTINLRLTSGSTAVHSDMLEWRSDYAVENAALQLLSIMFSVPQISIRFSELPVKHRQMLDFLLHFFIRHRSLLLKSELMPCYPDHNYPVVYAGTGKERIAVVYAGGFSVRFPSRFACETTYLVNATGRDEIIANLSIATGTTALLRNCLGETLPTTVTPNGLSEIPMPPASILKLQPATMVNRR